MPSLLAPFIARQLGNPSGLFGRLVLGPLWNRRNRALNDMALTHLTIQPDDRILEVGFGGGYLLGHLALAITSGFLAGIDISSIMVATCRKRHRNHLHAGRMDIQCAPAEAIPFPANHFTKVCSVNSIFYWRKTPEAFSELFRVLRAGGKLVLCFTCRQSLETRSFSGHGLTLYEPADVQAMLESCGFHDIAITRASDRHRVFFCMAARK